MSHSVPSPEPHRTAADVMVYINYGLGVMGFIVTAITGVWGWAMIGLLLIALSLVSMRLKRIQISKRGGLVIESHPRKDAQQ